MKKVISIFICFVLLFTSLCFNAYSATTLKYSVDAQPSGVYDQGVDTLHIMGWAFDTKGTVVRCYYSIDGSAGIQTDPVTRNDVVTAFSDTCTQSDCGFNQFISVDDLAFGSHTFKFYAKCGSTETILCETTFTVAGIKSDCNQIPSGEYNVEDVSVLTVVGWAFNYSGENTNCYYQIDNNAKILMPQKERTDVYEVYENAQLNCGFYYDIPISEFTIGSHTLKLIAISGTKEKIVGSSEIEIKSATTKIQYSVDFYPNGTYAYGTADTIHIGGWAFNNEGYETHCYYQIDSGEIIQLTADNRADVMNAFSGVCTQLDCGYKMDISISNLEKGTHIFKIIAKCSKISQVIKECNFTVVGSNGELKAYSEHILSGTYTLGNTNYAIVQGWGYNTSAEEVTFYAQFDSGTQFYLTASERTDVYNAKSDCYRTDCGYFCRVYLGNLSSGSHTITVKIVSGEKSAVVATGTFEIIRSQYTISFDANGGVGAPDPITKTFGKNLKLPSTKPTRSYYKFIGWNTSADGAGEYITGSYNYEASDTLYAIWEHEEFELASGSSLSFDAKSKLIYGEKLMDISSEELKNNFKNTVKTVNDSSIVTGSSISISDANGIYDTAYAVILGDINSDGNINGMDAVLANCIESGMLTKAQIGVACYSAADCVRDGKVDNIDINKLISSGLLFETVDQNVVKSREYYDTDFTIPSGVALSDEIIFNGNNQTAIITSTNANVSTVINAKCEEFNYYGLKYSSSTYSKGIIEYKVDEETYSEEFFLEPGEDMEFKSFIDGVFEGITGNELVSLSFVPLNATSFDFTVLGVAVFNRKIPDTITYIQNESIKIGLNMKWGGSLSYYEDLDSNVQAVSDKGIIKIDSNASEKYSTESLNDNVNLINCHDTGRLVQQSYYGTQNYEMGYYNGHYCAYNPVQGGNMYNEVSKIVDLQVNDNNIYVKCRPLDWAKSKEYITDSYMEATYTLCDDTLKTECRFVDFSGYDAANAGQEIPAFYSAATMDKFYYYEGDQPWTNGELSTLDKLDEYLYAHYPSVSATEHWGALTSGDSEDSFSIGLYVPTSEYIAAGVCGSIVEQSANPDISDPTSYLAGGKMMLFQSYDPIEYEFYITTGAVNDVRNKFKAIATSKES